MSVSQEQLENQLERARARVVDPRHGLFGPGSLMWKLGREQALFLAGGRAALLQEAHPFVAHGVDQHSSTRSDPRGRFERTFRYVHAITFGDLDHAFKAARRVHAIHMRIRGAIAEPSGAFAQGTPYEANDEAALLWVQATLWDSSIMVYELLVGPLSPAEKERYYQESKLFAYMFGLDDESLPPSYGDFVAYNRGMWASNKLFVGEPARSMAHFLLTSASPKLEAGMGWYRVITAGLLPQQVREAYGFPFGRRERAIFQASIPALRSLVRLLPRQLRYLPAYRDARARIGKPLQLTLAERMVGSHLVPSADWVA